jgi:hypothetical protein
LQAHSAASKLDNPGWGEATQGNFADDYCKAMELEILTLESIEALQVFDWEDEMNVISSTWSFKCKRYPDGLIKKFKARFCARGDQQLEGIDTCNCDELPKISQRAPRELPESSQRALISKP